MLVAALGSGCSVEPETDDVADALTEGTRPWDAAAERAFSNWIARLGTARAEGRCTKLNECINDPSINSLKSATDAPLDLFADCADVPMELRAYFAVKTRRPFRYVASIEGTGADQRYSAGNHPLTFASAGGSRTMQSLMTRISGSVHSGFFRMAPEVEESDTYPIKPSRASLRPGTVYYDPNGHVLIVYRVDADGSIWTIDGHPDNSLTFGRFAEGAYAVGGRAQGGGFRNFRPQTVDFFGSVSASRNDEFADYGEEQYGHGSGYFDWLTTALGGTAKSADKKFSEKLDQLCVDLNARIASVDAARGTAALPLGPLPPNIYAAEGDWEAFSTPSRDARLRASFRALYTFVTTALAPLRGPAKEAMLQSLGAAWRAHQASAACHVSYTNSAGAPVSLSLEAIAARVYDLSFDPYHCVEMRWGAHPSASAELASCPTADREHLERFDLERRNRNVIDREPVTATGADYGPETPADIDVAALLRRAGAL